MDAEISYPGPVSLAPDDQLPHPGAVNTDGSVSATGGAAATVADSENSLLTTVPNPRSSTQCELIALYLAFSLDPAPPQILTDSLASLQLLRN